MRINKKKIVPVAEKRIFLRLNFIKKSRSRRSSRNIFRTMMLVDQIKTAFAEGNITEETKNNAVEWLEAGFLPEWAVKAVEELVAGKEWSELNDRFFKKIAFGTGGMRGRTIGKVTPPSEMGTPDALGAPEHTAVGTANLNDFNIVRATVGLFRYVSGWLKKNGEDRAPRLVIAHDVRHFSKHFSELAASIWTKLGGEAFVFDGPRSTPQLSYTIRELGTDTGIVITASHNPSHDNGFKCYFGDGAQVISPHAEAIIENVNAVTLADIPQFLSVCLDGVKRVPAEAEQSYLAALEESVLDAGTIKNSGLKVCYTNIHGTGDVMILPALKKLGVDVSVVEKQLPHDGRFPTVKSPNPENAEAFTLAIEKAKETGADIILGTDPDDDRVGMAARNRDGSYTLYSGNQTGSMLTDFRIARMKELGIIPQTGTPKATIIKTFVTSPLQDAIAAANGVNCVNALTGFKWIGAKLQKYQLSLKPEAFEAEGCAGTPYAKLPWKKRAALQLKHGTFFVTGGEESYGYLGSDCVRDKDGNAAVLMIIEMASWAKAKGMNIAEYLDSIYKKYGFYSESLLNVVLEGAAGAAQIRKILTSLRENPPKEILGSKVVEFKDFGRDTIKDCDGDVIPKEDFYFFSLENGMKIAVRGSGTEPKCKFYIFASNGNPDLAKAKAGAAAAIEAAKAFLKEDAMKRANA